MSPSLIRAGICSWSVQVLRTQVPDALSSCVQRPCHIQQTLLPRGPLLFLVLRIVTLPQRSLSLEAEGIVR